MNRRLFTTFVLGVVAASAACGGQAERTERGATTGHVDLTFTGEIAGRVRGPAEVDCHEAVDKADRARVSIDSAGGLPVGETGVGLVALDIAAFDTGGKGGETAADDFFLLFDSGPDPFSWSGQDSAGTVTFDGTRGGRIDLTGWRDGDGREVGVDGSFSCGEE